jgi:MFS family permease
VRLAALVANFVVKDFVTIFGSKRSLFVSIGLNFLGSFCFLIAEGFFALFCGAFIIGINDQLVYIMFKIITNELFGDSFTHYLPICYAGYAFSPLLWPNLVSYIVNPTNIQPSEVHIEDGVEIKYFGRDIVSNFEFFIKLQMFIHLLLLTSASIFLPKPSKDHSRFSQFVQYLKNGNYKQANLLYHESKMHVSKQLNQTMRISIRNVSRRFSIAGISNSLRMAKSQKANHLTEQLLLQNQSKSVREMLPMHPTRKNESHEHGSISDEYELKSIPKSNSENRENQPPVVESKLVFSFDDSNQEINEDQQLQARMKTVKDYQDKQNAIETSIRSDLFSKLFVCIFVICIIRATTALYFFSNFKILGLYFFNDDMLINTLGSIAYIGYILVSFTFGNIFDRLGLRNGFLLMFGFFVAMNFIYANFASNITAYFGLSIVHRVGL